MKKDYFSIPQAALYKGVTRGAIDKAIRAGRLPTVTLIGRTAIKKADLDAYTPLPNDQRKGAKLKTWRNKEQETE